MPRKPTQLAKLTQPRLYAAAPRERLFSRLDACMAQPVTWVSGPPGAGKTTLVASYLGRRKQPALWYQVDAGDADPASFFHYLRLAAAGWSEPAARALPRARAIRGDELPAFARRFFRQLFSHLPRGAVLVVDNFHDAAECALSSVLGVACLEIPPKQSVVVISRGDAPAAFSDLQARGAMAQIRRSELSLTLDETRSLCRGRGVSEEWMVQALHRQSEGWAAGLTLMLERLRDAGSDARRLDSDILETVFDYFAGLILDGAPEETRRVLVSLAFLPSFTASVARRVSDAEQAASLLDQLYRRHLFIERRAGVEPVFQFHALFRRFLETRAAQSLQTEALARLIERSASAMEASGDANAAFELYARARDWRNAVRIISTNARALLDTGRWRTLQQWIDTLPAGSVEGEPWLEYWLASALAQTQPMAAVAAFERAQHRFLAAGERAGRVLSLAGLMHACSIDHRGYEVMERWLDPLAEELVAPPPFTDGDLELHAQGALLWAAFFLRPWHPCIVPCLERVEKLLSGDVRPSLALGPASSALGVAAQIGDLERAERLAARVDQLSSQPGASPVDMIWGQYQVAFQRFVAARYEEFLSSWQRAWSIAEADGLQAAWESSVCSGCRSSGG